MKKWFGRITAMIASAVLMLGAAAPVLATESAAGNWPVDIGKSDCSISLTLKYTDKGTNTEKNMSGGNLSLYTVATVKEENGYVFDISGGKFAGSADVAGIPEMTSADLDKSNATIAEALEKNISGVEASDCGSCKRDMQV